MAEVPPIRAYQEPILRALSERGGAATTAELHDAVVGAMGLSADQLAVPHGGGDRRSEIQYRMAWARTKLKKAGAIEQAGRGKWTLTAEGRQKISGTG